MEEVDELLKITIPIIDRHSDNHKSFNILEAAVKTRLKETTHSRILASLLKYKSSMLIRSFLEIFFKEYDFEDKKWNIEVEKNDVDIVLEGDVNIIIVENKVNGACERSKQIDRYVQHYLDSLLEKRIYVLYLNREYKSKPSPYSWSETEDECVLTACSYFEDVNNWIDSVSHCDEVKSDTSLYYALMQYQDYVNKMFCDQNMKKEIEQKVEHYLKRSDKADSSNSAKIAQLNKYINYLGSLQQGCVELKDKLVWEDIQNQINEYLKDEGDERWNTLLDQKEMGWDVPDAGVPFVLKGYKTQFYAVISYLQQRYIGIINTSQSEADQNTLKLKFSEILKDLGSCYFTTRRYPIWYKCSDNDSLIENYKKMLKSLKDDPQIECRLANSKEKKYDN